MLNEDKGTEYFSRRALACHGNERDTGHTGNFWNMTWALPGVVQSGPNATGAWMNEFGAWYFDLTRRWDGAFPHQGPPELKPDATGNWDATGAYLLAYAMPLKKIMLTGKRPTDVPPISAEEAKSIIIDGRGWTNKHRNEAYDAMSVDQLFKRLASWSPVVRERAAMALMRRKVDPAPIAELVKILESGNLNARYGLCTAFSMLGNVYQKLSFEEIKPLIPTILEAIESPSPSGIMFAEEVRLAGLRVLSKHHIDSGIQASADHLLNQNPWASEKRTPEILETLLSYGAHDQAAIPALERAAAFYEAGEVDFPMSLSQQKAAAVRDAISKIKASEDRPELKHID